MKAEFSYRCALLLLVVFAGEVEAQSSSGEAGERERQIIEEHNRKYVVSIVNKDASAFVRQYAADGWIMVPGLPIHCGPDAPADFFREVVLKKNIASGRFTTIGLYGVENNLLAEVGFYQFYDTSGTRFDDGKYIVLWKRTDGEWKRLRESFSSSR